MLCEHVNVAVVTLELVLESDRCASGGLVDKIHGFIGASPPSGRLEVEQRDVIGVRNILWGSDYPHFEGTWPYSRERMKAMFGGIPVEDVRLMLGESAVEVYGFDREKLAPIAERIGPPVSEFKDPSPVEAKDFLNLWRDPVALAELGNR